MEKKKAYDKKWAKEHRDRRARDNFFNALKRSWKQNEEARATGEMLLTHEQRVPGKGSGPKQKTLDKYGIKVYRDESFPDGLIQTREPERIEPWPPTVQDDDVEAGTPPRQSEPQNDPEDDTESIIPTQPNTPDQAPVTVQSTPAYIQEIAAISEKIARLREDGTIKLGAGSTTDYMRKLKNMVTGYVKNVGEFDHLRDITSDGRLLAFVMRDDVEIHGVNGCTSTLAQCVKILQLFNAQDGFYEYFEDDFGVAPDEIKVRLRQAHANLQAKVKNEKLEKLIDPLQSIPPYSVIVDYCVRHHCPNKLESESEWDWQLYLLLQLSRAVVGRQTTFDGIKVCERLEDIPENSDENYYAKDTGTLQLNTVTKKRGVEYTHTLPEKLRDIINESLELHPRETLFTSKVKAIFERVKPLPATWWHPDAGPLFQTLCGNLVRHALKSEAFQQLELIKTRLSTDELRRCKDNIAKSFQHYEVTSVLYARKMALERNEVPDVFIEHETVEDTLRWLNDTETRTRSKDKRRRLG